MLSKWWIPGGSHACPPSSLLEGHPPLDTPRSVDNPPEHEVGYALSARSLQARWVEISASLGSGSGCSATPLPPLAQRSISPGSLGRDLGFARRRQRLLRDAATSARSALDLSRLAGSRSRLRSAPAAAAPRRRYLRSLSARSLQR